jgi:hypothetical protein
MILKNSLNKLSHNRFLDVAKYLGINIESSSASQIKHYVDLEQFFLAGTYNLNSSRAAEGFLCWLIRFGHLLSPSKTRRLIQSGHHYDSSVLGGVLEFLTIHNIIYRQWSILKPFAHKNKNRRLLVPGPAPKSPHSAFLKYNIVVHKFRLNLEKFLAPTSFTYGVCTELKYRALFGSSVNADVASFLKWNPRAGPYQVAKETNNHKSRVFEVHTDVQMAL